MSIFGKIMGARHQGSDNFVNDCSRTKHVGPILYKGGRRQEGKACAGKGVRL
jgi:hypothetical protein